MKKIVLFISLVILPAMGQATPTEWQDVPEEIRVKETFTPQEWFVNYYCQLTEEADQAKIIEILTELTLHGKKALTVLDREEQELLSGGDSYSIACNIMDATYYENNISDMSNVPLLTNCFALMKTVYIIPAEIMNVNLNNRQEFINLMPRLKKIMQDVSSKAEECLQIIELNNY